MQGQQFKFFLIDDQGRSYFDNNGVVSFSSQPIELQNAPDGWQEMKITWERNSTYFGVFRNFTLPLSFILDGANILNTLFFNYNIEHKVYLVICENTLNIDKPNNEYFFYYKYLYKGEVDLSTFTKFDIEDGFKVTVNLMDGGAGKWLKSKQSTNYEIACNKLQKNNEIAVRLTGIDFFNKSNFATFAYDSGDMRCDEHKFSFLAFPLVAQGEEGDSFGIYTGDQTPQVVEYDAGALPSFAAYTNYFFKNENNYGVQIQIKGSINIKVYSNYPGYSSIKVGLVTENGSFYTSFINTVTTNTFKDYTATINTSVYAAPGEKLYLILNHFGFDPNNSSSVLNNKIIVTVRETEINLIYKTKLPTSIIYAQRPLNLFNELANKLTDNIYSATSTLLTKYKNKVITSGNAIRGIEDATIKTNMQDFFNAMNVQLNCGLGADEKNKKIVIEGKEYFYNINSIIHLGIAKSMKISNAKEYLFNSLKIGYPNQSNITTVNGKEEFNNTHQYQFPINKITKELNLVSPYRADGFGIEQIRKQTLGTEKISNPGDNECFVLEIEDTPTVDANGVSAYNIKKLPNGTTITGLFAENTAYNLGISPKRLFHKHTNFFESILYSFGNDKIKFQTTEQNSKLKTVKGTVVYDEGADVVIGDAFYFDKDVLFIPLIFEFETLTPINLVQILETNNNSAFSFYYNDILYYGFLIKPAMDISNNEPQQFTLLCAPNNNIKNLITNG